MIVWLLTVDFSDVVLVFVDRQIVNVDGRENVDIFVVSSSDVQLSTASLVKVVEQASML
jgi:hypothetical protein